MKTLIALLVFSVGLLLSWPPGEQAKASAADQVCFVGDVGHADYIAVAQNAVQYQSYEFAALKPPIECVSDGVIQKAPDFYAMYALNYRTCLNSKSVRNYNKLLKKSCVHQSIIRIRDDTSLV